MLASVFHLPGKVPIAGFKVARGSDLQITNDEKTLRGSEWVLVVNDNPFASSEWKSANQLQSDASDFLEFVKLTPDNPSGIVEFANRYGFLSGARRYKTADPPGSVFGEVVADWMNAVEAMKPAVDVWKLVRRRDRDSLKRFFRWIETKPGFPIRGVSGQMWVYDSPNSPNSPLAIVSDAQKDDQIEGVAEKWLRSRANGYISSLVSPQIDLDEQQGNVVRLIPQTLKAAIWLQFAFAICGEQEYRECEACGKPFGIDPRNKVSARKVYCSGSCRVKASRERTITPIGKVRGRKSEGKTTKKGKV
jgi:hypothetical protein